jgi:hypothetical protein
LEVEVSVVAPYWNRPEALSLFYEQIERWHSSERYEFLIVDDGCMKSPAWQGPANSRVISLPQKPYPLNPCVPLNAGAREAAGAVVVLTGCEVAHRRADDLERLVGLLEGPKDYVVAACHDTRRGWIQHSQHRDARLHWFTAIHRAWFADIGGFDEGFRWGYGWEDTDFVRRLESAGTNFVVTDDVIVDHQCELQREKLNARGNLKSNRSLYEGKWGRCTDPTM